MGSPLVQHLLPLLYSLNSLCYYINYFIYYFIFIMDIILVFIIRELWFKRFLKVLHGCCWRICNCFLAFIFLQKVPCDVGLCLIQPFIIRNRIILLFDIFIKRICKIIYRIFSFIFEISGQWNKKARNLSYSFTYHSSS